MTNFNFDKLTIDELGNMARYYSTYSDESIDRMVKYGMRNSLISSIKNSSKYFHEEMNGKFMNCKDEEIDTNNSAETSVENIINTMAEIRTQQAKAQAERMEKAERFVDNLCKRWAAAYGLESEYEARRK